VWADAAGEDGAVFLQTLSGQLVEISIKERGKFNVNILTV